MAPAARRIFRTRRIPTVTHSRTAIARIDPAEIQARTGIIIATSSPGRVTRATINKTSRSHRAPIILNSRTRTRDLTPITRRIAIAIIRFGSSISARAVFCFCRSCSTRGSWARIGRTASTVLQGQQIHFLGRTLRRLALLPRQLAPR